MLGIFAGHVYHFFTEVWPALGGKARLLPPKWILKRLGDTPGTNIKGVTFRRDRKGAEKSSTGGGGGKKGGLFATGAKKGKARKLK